MQIQSTFLRVPAVLRARGKSRSAHYLEVQTGLYPKPIKLAARSVGWLATEVEAMNLATVAGVGPVEMRKLARALEARRRSAWPATADAAPLEPTRSPQA